MQYDNYEQRIKRVARVLSVIVRLLPIIIPTVCLIIAGVSTLLAVKGTVGEVTVSTQITYGQSIKCEASAFMSDVSYEYAADPNGEWIAQAPTFPGTYYVRAVGEGSFGTVKHSAEVQFAILPKTIDVSPSPSVVYGETPTLTGSLEYGDQLVCDKFEYADILADKTLVTPVASSVRIVDANGNDVSNAYNINIVPASVKIVPRKITVTVEDSSTVYNGKDFSFDKYELTGGELVNGDNLIAVFDKSIKDVGTIKNVPASLKVVTADGKDATSKYTITQNVGTLSVEKRTVVIKTGDYTATYDGEDHKFYEYEIDPSTPLAKNHTSIVTSGTVVKNSGEYDNILEIKIVDAYGEDKTSNHSMFFERGTLKIEKCVLTVVTSNETWIYDSSIHSGDVKEVRNVGYMQTWHASSFATIRNVGTVTNSVKITVFDFYGRDTTSNYIIDEQFGTLEVTKRTVRIKTRDYHGTYNGKEQKNWYWDVTVGAFQGDDVFKIISGTAHTDVINTQNEIFEYTITNPHTGEDVSECYDLGDFETGTFTISQNYISIKPEDVAVTYDGKAHGPTDIQIISTQWSVPTNHTITCQMSGTRTDVGETLSYIVDGSVVIKDENGRDITHNYNVSYDATGTITITQRLVYVETKSATKMYDGTPLTKHEHTVAAPTEDCGLVEGHELSLDGAYTGTQTNVGISDNTATLSNMVITHNGKDVTSNYNIKLTCGTLEVTKRPITVESYSAEKKYDGTPLTAGGGVSDSTEYPIVQGHNLFLDITGTRTSIGKSNNNIVCENTVITDENGTPVTDNYEISYVQGELVVKPWAIITISSESDEKAYDGTPLTNHNYTITYTDGALKEGHSEPVVTVTGTRTEVGISKNTFSVGTIKDEFGNSATAYYTIRRVYGTLEVYEPKEYKITVAKVLSDKGGLMHLRQNSYGVYNGTTGWGSSLDYGTTLPGGYSYNYLTSFALKNFGVTERIAQIDLITENYMLPYYIGTSGNNTVPGYDTHYTGIIEYDYTVSHYNLPTAALENIYSLRGNLGEYTSYEQDYRDFVDLNYLDIPTSTKAYMLTVIAEQGFDINDGSVIYKIASYIRNSATYNLAYDTALDTSGDVAVEFLRTYKEGVCRHYATSAVMLYRALGIPARYVTGYMVNTEAGVWTNVTTPGHAWVEVYIYGVGWIQVEVTGSMSGTGSIRPKLELIPEYQSKAYDGEPLEAKNELDITASLKALLDEGYTFDVVIRGSQTDVGRGASTISEFKLYDPDGNDVTENFDIDYKEGVLEVFPADKKTITVLLYELEREYNGKVFAFGGRDWEALDLESGLSLELELDIWLIDVGCLTISDINGNIEKYATFTVKDSNGNDVTSKYRLVFDASNPDGTEYIPINIISRDIEITAASESKTYDGELLVNSKVSVTMGSLAEGHTLYAIARGSITDVGEVINDIDLSTVMILDAVGNDVTKNYRIVPISGILEVVESEED